MSKTPLFVDELKAWLHESRVYPLDPLTAPLDPSRAQPPQSGATTLNHSSSPTWLDRLLCTLVARGSAATLTAWDRALLLLLAYEVLGLRLDAGGLTTDLGEVVRQLEVVSGLVGDLMSAWVHCYSALERDSRDSLVVLVGASSDEEPSGTESDRERKVQQFKEGLDYAILQTAHRLYYLLRCTLFSWHQLATAAAGQVDEQTLEDALSVVLTAVLSSLSQLKKQYISFLTQVLSVGVFLQVWATWTSLVLHSLESRSHSSGLCSGLATHCMQFEARHTLITAVTNLCTVDSVYSRQDLAFWLPESLQDCTSLLSVVLEKLAAILRHSNTHITQRTSRREVTSPLQRRKQASEVEELTRSMGEMASSVLELSRSEPQVQLSILYLLSVAVSEPVAIVEAFLPLLSTGHLHSELSLLERHLAVVEGALLQLQPSAIKEPGWWGVLRHLSSLMKQCSGNLPVIQFLLHYHQVLLKGLPHPAKHHLWEQSVQDFLLHALSGEADSAAKEGGGGNEAAALVTALLRTVEVGLADERCLQSLVARPQCYLLLASLLPLSEHVEKALSILRLLLCPPQSVQSPTVAKAQDHCVSLLVRVALSASTQQISQLCRSVALSSSSSSLLRPLDMSEMDQLQVSFRRTYGCDAASKVCVTPDLLRYLSLLSLVWGLLEEVGGVLRTQLLANSLHDVRDSFGPAIAGILSRLCGPDEGQVSLAKERVAEVVCHLLRVYMDLVGAQPETSSKVGGSVCVHGWAEYSHRGVVSAVGVGGLQQPCLLLQTLLMLIEDLHPWMEGVMQLRAGQRYCHLLFLASLFTAEGPPSPGVLDHLPTKWKGPSFEEYLAARSTVPKRKGLTAGERGYDADLEGTDHSSNESPLPGRSLMTPPPAVQSPVVSEDPIVYCAHSVVKAFTQGTSANR